MARAKKEKETKSVSYKFYGFNVKLQSNERKGSMAYLELIQTLFAQDILGRVSSEKAMILRTQFIQEVNYQNTLQRVVYGKISRFTLLEGENWYNRKNKDFVKYKAPDGVFPNAYETDYIFIPEVHRFFIKKNPRIGVNTTKLFLENSLKQIVTTDENIIVNVMQSSDIIDYIIANDHIQYLKVNVSYTNDDIGSDAQEFMDELLKDGNIGSAEMIFKPDQNNQISTKSKMVRGLLEVAKENGTAEATVINEKGRKEKIMTKDHPKQIIILATEDELMRKKLLKENMEKYREDE